MKVVKESHRAIQQAAEAASAASGIRVADIIGEMEWHYGTPEEGKVE